jgi:GR25 family glycosyltransferase involved in LPS biosynthesis
MPAFMEIVVAASVCGMGEESFGNQEGRSRALVDDIGPIKFSCDTEPCRRLPSGYAECLEGKGLIMPKITNFIVINLKEATKRRHHMESMLGNKNISAQFLTVHRPSMAECQNRLQTCPDEKSLGLYGVWRGHQQAWQEVVKSKNDFTAILEDDVLLPGKYDYRNWDVGVPLDSHIIFLESFIDFERGNPRAACTKVETVPYCKDIKSALKCLEGRSTIGYVITRLGAKRLLEKTMPPAFKYHMAIDEWIFDPAQSKGINVHVAREISVQTYNPMNDNSDKDCLDWQDGVGCKKYEVIDRPEETSGQDGTAQPGEAQLLWLQRMAHNLQFASKGE